MSNFDETVIRRLTALEREVERLRVKERPVGGGGGVTDHGALTGLSDNDHPQYLLTTGKAADADKLDGIDSTGFATAGHDHDSDYLGISAKAADSDKVDGFHASKTPTASTVPVSGTDKKLDNGWLKASATPTANLIPIAGTDKKLDAGWLPSDFSQIKYFSADKRPYNGVSLDVGSYSVTASTYDVPSTAQYVIIRMSGKWSGTATDTQFVSLRPTTDGTIFGISRNIISNMSIDCPFAIVPLSSGKFVVQVVGATSYTVVQIMGYIL